MAARAAAVVGGRFGGAQAPQGRDRTPACPMQLARMWTPEEKDKRSDIMCCAAGWEVDKKEGGRRAVFFIGKDDGNVMRFHLKKPSGWPEHYCLEPDWEDRLEAKLRKKLPGPVPGLNKVGQTAGSRVGKKPICQLEVDSANQRLFVLQDGGVSMCRWQGGEIEVARGYQAPGTDGKALKGAVCFCISPEGTKGRLCVCLKKKAILYSYTGDNIGLYTGECTAEATEAEALRTSDTIVHCVWIGSRLCLAAKDEYKIVDTDTLGVHITCKVQKPGPGPLACVLNDRLEVVQATGEDDAGEEAGDPDARGAEFSTVIYLLTATGKHSLLISPSGDMSRGPPWPVDLLRDKQEPLVALCANQFLVGVLQDGIHVRSLFDEGTSGESTTTLVPPAQPVPAGQAQDFDRQSVYKQMQCIAGSDTHVYLCTSRDVFALTVVPYHEQVLQRVCELATLPAVEPTVAIQNAELLLRLTFPHGLQASAQRAPADPKALDLRLAHMYKEAGFAQYEKGRMELAFDCFHRSWEAAPEYFDVRELFDLFHLIGPLKDYMSTLQKSSRDRPTVRELATSLGQNAAGLLGEKRGDSYPRADRALYDFLKKVRRLRLDDPDAAVADESIGGAGGAAAPASASATDQARALDTALLLLYLRIPDFDPAVNPKADAEEIRQIMCEGNWLEHERCQCMLQDRGKYRCLALLMMYNGDIEKALKVLKQLSEPGGEFQEPGQTGVRETVLALQHCCHGEADNAIVLEHLPWILEKDPDVAIDALLVRRNPPIPPDKVMALIEDFPDDIVLKYLRHIVYEEKNTQKEYHTQLALIWIRSIVLLMPLTCVKGTPLSVRAGEEAGLLGEMRRDLRRFLEESPHYSESEVLAHLYGSLHASQGQSPLYEELVVVYSRTGEHDAALRVLLYDMRDPAAAQSYCEQQYQQALDRHLQRHLSGAAGTASPIGALGDAPARFTSGLESMPEGGTLSGTTAAGIPLSISGDTVKDLDALGGGGGTDQKMEKEVSLSARSRPEELLASHAIPIKDSRGNIFTGIRKHNTYLLDMLNLCLHPDRGKEADRKPDRDLALELLSRHSRSLDPLQVLDLVPADMFAVEEMRPYLRQVFHHIVGQSHQERIRCQLAQANQRKHTVDRGIMQRRSVLIDQERMCEVCQGRIRGGDVFGVYPNMKVAHRFCMGAGRDKDPLTKKPFWVDLDAVHPREKYCD
eukprot:TRINITY_DN70559_c0_g1_i1.p1 TRINITY_DN70559_c0_g1~~TRINITY_DN70559_c0_g1_i1.p1  ORF type:complete len:1244 (+),score=384.19 TRINITY_DN70559_c0_g1_i1:118-3732(+)